MFVLGVSEGAYVFKDGKVTVTATGHFILEGTEGVLTWTKSQNWSHGLDRIIQWEVIMWRTLRTRQWSPRAPVAIFTLLGQSKFSSTTNSVNCWCELHVWYPSQCLHGWFWEEAEEEGQDSTTLPCLKEKGPYSLCPANSGVTGSPCYACVSFTWLLGRCFGRHACIARALRIEVWAASFPFRIFIKH